MNIQEQYFCSRCMRELPEECVCPFCGHDPASPADSWALEEGTLFQDGRYQLGAVIGAGGFGITYAAWDHTLQMPVAVKEYFPSALASRDARLGDRLQIAEGARADFALGLQRFRRESRILASLQNVKSVVKVCDWFDGNQTAYLVMEFVRGVTLEAFVARKKPAPDQLLAMLREVIESLDAVHQIGVLHRDISPSNLLVREDGRVTLIDFGSAALRERRASGRDRTVLLNKAYAALEQYDPDGEQGPWTDVYGMSATLYALLTGSAPPEAVARREHDALQPPRARGVRLKKWQEKALLAGLAVQPARRIRSMAEFRARLYGLPLPEELRRRKRLLRRLAAAAAAFTLAAAALLLNATRGFPLGAGLWYSLRTDGFHVVAYTGDADSLALPARRLAIPVSGIGSGAFRGASGLRRVEIPGSVAAIDALAFSGCAELQVVLVEEGNRSIGDYAFSDCAALHTVRLPASTDRIAAGSFTNAAAGLTIWGERGTAAQEYALGAAIPFAVEEEYATRENGSGLTVTGYQGPDTALDLPDYIREQPVTGLSGEEGALPDSLESLALPLFLAELPEGALTGHEALTALTLNPALEVLGPQALSGTSVEALTLPEGLRVIGDRALYQTPIRQLALPESVAEIGRYAFAESFLEILSMPDSVTRLGEGAFSACTQLQAVRLSAGLDQVPGGAFEGCSALTLVVLPEGLTGIGELAFSNCDSLETIRLPEGLAEIGPYAFSECASLRLVYIPASVTRIDPAAFDGCSASLVITGLAGSAAERFAERCDLTFVDMSGWPETYQVSSAGLLYVDGATRAEVTVFPDYYEGAILKGIMDARQLTSRQVVLPAHSETVSTLAFSECDALEQVTFPAGLKSIGAVSFWNCDRLRVARLPAGLERVGSAAFADCASLAALTLPDSLSDLGWGAFSGCSSLTGVTLPASLTVLQDGVFARTGLRQVTIPGNVTKCRTAFYACRQLESAVAEEGVRALWGTFAGCDALTTVALPASLQQISLSTFRGCTALRDVWIYSMDADLEFTRASIKYMQWNGADAPMDEVWLEQGDTAPLFADCPNVTIHGYPGSTAEAYAERYGIRFEPI